MPPEPITEFVITPYAQLEMGRRGLNEETVRWILWILSAPEQRLEVRPGRILLQSRVSMGEPPRMYLIRVIVDIDRQPAEVVTVYRTGKVSKYWRGQA